MSSTTEMLFNEANPSNMLFSKLPVEICLLIWDTLFSEIPSAPRKQFQSPTNNLSILRCSRGLYDEISYHLYKSLTHFLHIPSEHLEGRWIAAGVISDKMYVWWDLKDEEAVREHLSIFPCAKLREPRVHVELRRSSIQDPGRIIQLWQKTNTFVDILQNQQRPPQIRVRFAEKWQKLGKARASIPHQKGYRPDHDIAILPFTRLPKSQWDYFIYDELDAAISGEPEGSPHSILYRLKNGENLEAAELDSLHLDTRIFLDTKLDFAPGRTADFLRLKRFQHWYYPGDNWKVSYEEQLLADLTNNLLVVMKHDPRLHSARKRFGILVIMHHLAHARRDSAESIRAFWPAVNGEPVLYNKWESEIFPETWPNGLSQLQNSMPKWVMGWQQFVFTSYAKKNDKIRDFQDELFWWAYDAWEFLYEPISEGKWCRLCRFLERPCVWCKKYDSKKACRLCREGFPLRLLPFLPHDGLYNPSCIVRNR